jgi:hypothetical protein
MSEEFEIAYTQLESPAYLDPDYEQVQEQLALDWLEQIDIQD